MEEKVNQYEYPYHWGLSTFHKAKYLRPLDFFLSRIQKDQTVLDVGCGDGKLVQQMCAKAGTVIGLDVQDKPIRMAKILLEDYPQADVRVYDGKHLPLQDASVDWLTCFDVIEHIPLDEVQPLLKEFRRVLKPEGTLVLTTPNRNEWRGRFFGHRINNKHYQEFTVTELKNEVMRAGFHTRTVRGIYLPLPIPKVEHYASVIPFRGFFRWLIRLGDRHPEWAETMYLEANHANV